MGSDIKNKVIVIIGAEGLMGTKIASQLIALGAKVTSADKSITEKVDKTNLLKLFVDITDELSLNELLNEAEKKYKKIDCLINVSYPKSGKNISDLNDVSYEDFCKNVNLHLGGYFLATKIFANYFNAQGKGNIINFSSIYGVVQPKFEIYKNTQLTMPIHYSAIKSAIIHLTGYYAKYYKGKNIRFNTISPGGIFDNHQDIFSEQYKLHTLNKGLLDPKDILGAIEFLVSDSSKYINGQNIIVDDGFSL